MADDAILKRIEERLTRLEASLSQGVGSFTPPGGTVVDPPPWGGGVVSDPAPWWGRHHHWPYPFPHPIADPVPFPRYPIADPAPYPYAYPYASPYAQQAAFAGRRFPFPGPIGDPPPPDISRLSIAQLEASLHTINAERARLDAMETMVKQRLSELKK